MTTAAPPLDPESLVARIIAELQATPGAQTLLLRAMLTNEFRGMPLRLEHIEADIAELKAYMMRIEPTWSCLEADLAVLKANILEVKLHRRIRPLLMGRLGLRRLRTMQCPVSDTSPKLYEPVEAALDNGIITDAQEDCVSATDIILRAQRKADRSPVWVAVEVSNDISQRDIERVRQSADALSMVFQQDTMASLLAIASTPRTGAGLQCRCAYAPHRGERLDARGYGRLRPAHGHSA